jgi:hypothetical protein
MPSLRSRAGTLAALFPDPRERETCLYLRNREWGTKAAPEAARIAHPGRLVGRRFANRRETPCDKERQTIMGKERTLSLNVKDPEAHRLAQAIAPGDR